MNKKNLIVLLLLSSQMVFAKTDYHLPSEKYTLDTNGLDVILYQDKSLPIVAVNLWYHAGPINESSGKTGFAHLFEHLMFQGSAHVDDDKHFEMLTRAGASSINGTTGFDRTNYFETLPSNELALALWLESDRMGFLLDTLTQKKLDNQREVVKNERRQSVENVPYGKSNEKFYQTLFEPTHPYYGYVIGSMEDLSNANLEDVKSFFTNFYAPSNATLVIAGDFEKENAKELVQKYFGHISRRDAPKKIKIKTLPITKERRVEVKENLKLAAINIGFLSPSFYEEGDATADILAFILGSGKSSRFYRLLVDELQLAQSVEVSQQSQELSSIFSIRVIVRQNVDVKKIEHEINKLIESLKKILIPENEIKKARNMLITKNISSLQNIGSRADFINRYNHYLGVPDYLSKDIERYFKITPIDIQNFAKKYLGRDQRVVLTTIPNK